MFEFPAVRLVSGRGKVLEPFFSRVNLQPDIRELVWVSPWLSHFRFKTGSTQGLIQKLSVLAPRLTIITRSPEPGSEHEEFLRGLLPVESAEIYFLERLHAKFYICTTRNRAFAMIGSSNLYRWTKGSFEVGVMIEARGDGEILISDLEGLALELRTHRDSVRTKPMEV